MKIRKHWLWPIPALGVAIACGTADSEPAGAAAWSTSERSVSYQIEEKLGEEQQAFQLQLDFEPDSVSVSERGSVVVAKMDASGRLAYSSAAPNPPAIYELIALSVLPPAGEPLEVGHSWTYTRPDDEAAATSDGLVAQERFDYQIVAVDDAKIVVDVKGFLRLAPSVGLTQVIEANHLPAAYAALATTYKPYVVGSAEFDRSSGETLQASGARLPFAFMTEGAAIQPGINSIEYSLVRQ